MKLPIIFYLYRGTLNPDRCSAEILDDHGDPRQCKRRPHDDDMGAPLCTYHKKWITKHQGEST